MQSKLAGLGCIDSGSLRGSQAPDPRPVGAKVAGNHSALIGTIEFRYAQVALPGNTGHNQRWEPRSRHPAAESRGSHLVR